MVIEPAYDPDGSVAAWLCYRLDQYIGSVCRTGRARWQANNAEGGIIAVARTRKQALAHIDQVTSCKHAWQAHDVYGFNCTKCDEWTPLAD